MIDGLNNCVMIRQIITVIIGWFCNHWSRKVIELEQKLVIFMEIFWWNKTRTFIWIIVLSGISLVKKLMFSELKNTAKHGAKWNVFSADNINFFLGYEKYIKIQRGSAVYFERIKICRITFGISWRIRPFPPDSTKFFSLGMA